MSKTGTENERKRGKRGKKFEPGSKKTGSGESWSNAFFFSVNDENFLVFFIHLRKSEYTFVRTLSPSQP
jgi:hypothetical protein